MTNERFVPAHRAQRGGALLVAMIMVFLTSVMGLSVLRSSTMERRMASNAIQAREVSQMAESVTERMLNDNANLTRAFVDANDANPANDTLTVRTTEDEAVGHVTLGTLRYVGGGLAPGFSAGTFEALRYIAGGTAEIDTVGARSTIEQGAFQAVPTN